MPQATTRRLWSSPDADSDSEHGKGGGVTRPQRSMGERELPIRSRGPWPPGNQRSCPSHDRGTPGPGRSQGGRTCGRRPDRLNGAPRWTR
jgi:hypothetical protein